MNLTELEKNTWKEEHIRMTLKLCHMWKTLSHIVTNLFELQRYFLDLNAAGLLLIDTESKFLQ